MDAQSVSEPAGPPDTSVEPAKRRRRRVWPIVVILVAILSAGAGGYLWLTRASVLQDFGDGWGLTVRPAETAYVDAGIYPASGESVTIDLRTVRPRVVQNTAGATVDVLTCTVEPGSTRIGSVRGPDMRRFCASATPWRSGMITIGSRAGDYLVFAITPRREGRVEIAGEDVSYRHGIRFGTQHTGGSIEVTGSLAAPSAG